MLGIPSHYNSSIELCKRLASAGFVVTLACDQDITALIDHQKMSFSWLRADHDSRQSMDEFRQTLSSEKPWIRRITLFKKQRLRRLESLSSDEIEQLTLSTRPDVLLIDIECHKAIIQTRKLNIPTVLCSNWFSITRQPHYPPLHSSHIPDNSLLSALASSWQWHKLFGLKRFIRLRQMFSLRRFYAIRYKNIVHADLKQLARHEDLVPRKLFARNGWLIPHHYQDIPIVSLVPPELDFKPGPSDHTYVGPVVSETNHAFSIDDSVLDAVDTFVQSNRQSERSILYFSLGTYMRLNPALLRTLADILAKRNDFALIVGLGGLPAPIVDTTQHDNILYLSAAPQIDVLKVVDLAILHGGIGSLNEALVNAVPTIIFSVHTNDQNGCAARMKHHRLGCVLDIDTINGRELERHIDTVLKDATLKERLNEFSTKMKLYQKPGETVKRFLSVCPPNIQQAIQING